MMIHRFEDKSPRIHESAYVSWNAEVEGEVELGELASVWFNATIRGDLAPIVVGRLSSVQDGAVVHVAPGRPCSIGEGVTVGHGAILHGCSIGAFALIGMGAVILDEVEIGSECIVGAGALVTQGKKFPPRTMILGSPAKAIRALRLEEVASLHEHTMAYVELGRRTKAGCREE